MWLLLVLACWENPAVAYGGQDVRAHCALATTTRVDTADGATIALHHHPAAGPPVILVHGISSNHHFWDLDAEHSFAEWLAVRGTATIVGVLPPDATIEFPWMAIRPECKVQTSRMGSNQFRTDIPNYLEFYRQGRLKLDEMVSRRGRLSDINEAFRAMKAGEVARTVLVFD
jgi:threonine dehydrogenase-like Zn-dependent dehydrogenase